MMKLKPFYLIAACDLQNGIGRKNDLPWCLKQEYQHFQRITQCVDEPIIKLISNQSKCSFYNLDESDYQIVSNEKSRSTFESKDDDENLQTKVFNVEDRTNLNDQQGEACTQNCVIMGRETWLSIPENFRPLKNRFNLVLSRTQTAAQLGLNSKYVFKSLKSALEYASTFNQIARVFIVGGEQIYRQAIEMPECVGIYITRVYGSFDCDRFFPTVDSNRFVEVDSSDVNSQLQTENNLSYRFHLLLDRKWLSNAFSIEKEAESDEESEEELSR